MSDVDLQLAGHALATDLMTDAFKKAETGRSANENLRVLNYASFSVICQTIFNNHIQHGRGVEPQVEAFCKDLVSGVFSMVEDYKKNGGLVTVDHADSDKQRKALN